MTIIIPQFKNGLLRIILEPKTLKPRTGALKILKSIYRGVFKVRVILAVVHQADSDPLPFSGVLYREKEPLRVLKNPKLYREKTQNLTHFSMG